MSMNSDTTVLHGVTPPKPDLDPEPEPKRLKSEPELGSEQKPKLTSAESYRQRAKADALYLKRSQNPYNAIAAPSSSQRGGAYWPIRVFDKNNENDKKDLPMIKNLSKTALLHYQEEHSGESFKFHKLLRCTYRVDCHPNKYRRPEARDPTRYYITFKAKSSANGDPSNSRDMKTFLATVLVDVVDKTKPPVVEECRIKGSFGIWKGKKTIF